MQESREKWFRIRRKNYWQRGWRNIHLEEETRRHKMIEIISNKGTLYIEMILIVSNTGDVDSEMIFCPDCHRKSS